MPERMLSITSGKNRTFGKLNLLIFDMHCDKLKRLEYEEDIKWE